MSEDTAVLQALPVEPIQARYRKTGVSRFAGNPFIEALPPLERKKSDFVTLLSHNPPVPTAQTRKACEIVRTMELSTIGDVVISFPEYADASLAVATIMRDTYVARNPLTAIDRQRRHALASAGADGLPFPSDWRSSAKGHLMIAVSGMGKTTFARALLLGYPQVIRHTSYEGQELKCIQVVYVFLRVPHDATLKGLCIRFFKAIDALLGTNYARQARALRQIAAMMQLMNTVATAVSLGFLVIDEVQNLRTARGGNAEFVLNLFSEIIEDLGISLLTLATPAIQDVIAQSVRNARKLASHGETVLRPMKRDDPMWQTFCEKHWEYTYTRKKGSLSPEILNAWHTASAGNSAFASLSFLLAQRREIGGRELVDEASFERVTATDMAFLQPAIRALLSGKPSDLVAFDDLLFSEKYEALRNLLGTESTTVPSNRTSTDDEFDDVPQAESQQQPPPRRTARKTGSPPSRKPPLKLPAENPLQA